MRKAVFVFLVLVLPLGAVTAAYAAASLESPQVEVESIARAHYLEEVPEASRCNYLLSKVAKIVKFANMQFRRRTWTADFLAERFLVAKKFSARSRYVMVKKGDPQAPSSKDPIVGTIGVTYARYDAETLKRVGAGLEKPQLIPVEDTLKLKSLPRPLDSHGRGIIFELRTYAKSKKKGRNAFPKLLQAAYDLVFKMIEEFPELYEEPILYFYGDDLSQRFYRGFGFHVVEDIPPVMHDGTEWRVMAASPKDIEAVVSKLEGYRWIQNLNQPYLVKAQNGKSFLIPPKSGFTIDSNNVVIRAESMTELEVAPGIFAAPYSDTNWHAGWTYDNSLEIRSEPSVKIINVVKLSRPAFMKTLAINIPTGGTVDVTEDGEVIRADRFSEPLVIDKLGVTVAKSGGIQLDLNPYSSPEDVEGRSQLEEITIFGLDRKTELNPGLWAPRGSTVTFRKFAGERKYRVFRIEKKWGGLNSQVDLYVLRNGKVLSRAEYYKWVEKYLILKNNAEAS